MKILHPSQYNSYYDGCFTNIEKRRAFTTGTADFQTVEGSLYVVTFASAEVYDRAKKGEAVRIYGDTLQPGVCTCKAIYRFDELEEIRHNLLRGTE